LDLEIIRDARGLAALKSEWDGLFERSIRQTPFLRHSWATLCWTRHSCAPGKLFIIVIRDAGRTVLIAPFVARVRRLIFFDLSFLDSMTPHYNEVLVEQSDHAETYISRLCDFIKAQRRLRKLQLQWQRADSPLWPHLEAIPTSGIEELPSPYIDLTQFSDWQTYYAGLSKNLRTDHGRKLRQLGRTGTIDFRLSNETTVAQDVAWLFAAKRDWHTRKQKAATWLQQPETEALFAAAAAEGIASGRTWLTVLSLDGNTVAAYLNFRERQTLFLSKLTYDEQWQHYSVGRALMLMTLEHAFKNGIETFDLMISSDAWKNKFATGTMSTRSVRLAMQKRFWRSNSKT
jgi:CelD/BcsL family acetyltransferase involved in cellulose biosynthesis